ncbi:MAG TPA: SBBP repeat-containing protein [Bryobacteraceae bacterium]|jgi:hypothetical protein
MFRMSRFALFVCAVSVLAAAGRPSVSDPAVSRAKAALAQLPLRFEPTQGGADPAIRYTARGGGYTLLLTDQGPTLAFPSSRRIDLSLLNSSRAPQIEALDRLSSRTDYYLGRRENWRKGVASYSRVRYRQVYPGVDVVYYGNQSQLEYDFVLQPGADPNAIRLKFRGASRVHVSPEGDLMVEAGGDRILQKRPFIYQDDSNGSPRREVQGRYVMLAHNVVGLRLDRYDRSRQLVIDPVIQYCSYLGGSGTDQINAVKLTAAGLLYVAGNIANADLTAIGNAYNTTSTGNVDAFVAVLDTTAAGAYGLVYLTYLGGTNNDVPSAIDVDSLGYIYLTGTTNSTDFPMVTAFQSTGAGATVDSFVAKLDPNQGGSNGLVFSSYLGGTTGDDTAHGMAVGPNGMIYVIGTTKSSDFPVTSGAYQPVSWGPSDAFLCQIDSNAAALVYSTYLGGEGNDDGRAILVGKNGLVYFAASTLSTQFPMAAYNYSGVPIGAEDIIVGVMDMTQSGTASLVYSTYFGGSANEEVRAMAFDSKGNLVITGYTLSSDFPATRDALQPSYGGNSDAFVAVVNPATLGPGFLVYATYLGGAHGDVGYGVAADSAGYLYVTGYTLSSDFPVANALQSDWGNGTDVFLTKFRPGVAGKNSIQYSTYLGATGLYVASSVAVGLDGTAFVVGYGRTGLPSQGGYAGGATDGFILAVGQ